MSQNKQKRVWLHLLSLSLAMKYVSSSCLTTNGISFKEYPAKFLNMAPYKSLAIMNDLECLLGCEADTRCNSLNIKRTGDELNCELLTGDSSTSSLVTSSTSSFHEIMHYDDKAVSAATKRYCEPECKYFKSCKTDLTSTCRCLNDGRMLALNEGRVAIVGVFGDKYASVKVTTPSGTYKIKLVHMGGILSCSGRRLTTNFGCKLPDGTNKISMVITNKNNTVLLPGTNGYSHDGTVSHSSFVTFNDPVNLKQGEEIRIWYKEDLDNYSEDNNIGSALMFVFGLKEGV